MTTGQINGLLADILALAVFSGLRDHPLLGSLRVLLADMVSGGWGNFGEEAPDKGDLAEFEGFTESWPDLVQDWAAFTSALLQFSRDSSFYLSVARLVAGDDNPFTHAAEGPGNPPPVLCGLTKTDLSRLGRIAGLEIHSLGFQVAEILRKAGLEQAAQNIEEESRVLWAAAHQPEAETELAALFPGNSAWGNALPGFIEYLRSHGAGVLGRASAFSWHPQVFAASQDASEDLAEGSLPIFMPPSFVWPLALRPVANPDPVNLEDLQGYEAQRSVVIANTRRFLEGKPANNLLLYGDRGTGKSATVKAVCRAYAEKNLKLIEARKSDLAQLPALLDLLGSRSRSFIIFIDDLSFETTDDSFRSLKAFLEGGLETRPANVVIYATSNRRHLVRERTVDRPDTAQVSSALATGDMRAFDTMQEQLSLADRFGLTLVYSSPSQEEYLAIAEHIARRRGILPDERFRENALRWEKWFNGRSPRTATQFVDWLEGGAGFPCE
ncbi:MAG: ATP-binding protein [Treponema sp.]|jgi:predicted AAA+ superfamily ATPase|nr:ATP-binding protein [Treponema sp.]